MYQRHNSDKLMIRKEQKEGVSLYRKVTLLALIVLDCHKIRKINHLAITLLLKV